MITLNYINNKYLKERAIINAWYSTIFAYFVSIYYLLLPVKSFFLLQVFFYALFLFQ